METYPKSQHKQELISFLLSSYTSSGNYDEVIDLLSSQNDYKDDRLLQKITFLKAIQLFSSGEYQKAKTYFQKSINNNQNNKITAQSYFWKGQSDYELNDFNESLNSFREFEKNSPSKQLYEKLEYHYNLGYTLFKIRNYSLSLKAFEKVVQKQNLYSNSKIRDAFLRLGDAHYGLSKFWLAMEYYDKSIAISAQSDYAFIKSLFVMAC